MSKVNYDLIKYLLNQKGMSFRDLAESLGMSYSTLMSKRTFKRETSINEIINIASFLQKDIKELIFFEKKDGELPTNNAKEE